ncbi:MAG TPA: hypothetical protein VJI46_02100 [Candidatus Nanoarchaeia archaeon]|nr:hypothetical protein [Candidatus Nanoarchaeia archaeon]
MLDIISNKGVVCIRQNASLAERIEKEAKKIDREIKKAKLPRKERKAEAISEIVKRLARGVEETAKKEKEAVSLAADNSEKAEGTQENDYRSPQRNFMPYDDGARTADYGKIWGHLGKDTVVRMYGGSGSGEISSGEAARGMVPYQSFERAMKSIKYFTPGGSGAIMLDAFFGNVPAHGMDSKEWDKMKLYMMVDNGVMFKLMMGTGI